MLLLLLLMGCAVAAMDRAIDRFLHGSSSDDDAQLELWPEEAVQLLLFTCSKDPSVRLRRAAMSLLTSVVSRQQSTQEHAIVHALVLKCRDKDAKVQSQAYQMILQLPIEALTAHLRIEDWRAALDTALLSRQAGLAGNLADGDEQQQKEVQSFGAALLHKYLVSSKVLQPLSEETVQPTDAVAGVASELDTVVHASQYLQPLQLPWHNIAVYQAYSSALSDHAQCQNRAA